MANGIASVGTQEWCLRSEEFSSLSAMLFEWRVKEREPFVQRAKSQGRVFDFVKGLRFSARLIYIMREALSGCALEVDWGQVVSDNGALLSPECDVIVHEPGHTRRWNGGKADQVMDFKFIRRSGVLAVISCKSFLNSIRKKDKEYCARMKPYVGKKRLWLFAECVPMGKEANLSEDSKKAGYSRFWYLYSWERKNSRQKQDKRLWADFLKRIEALNQ